MIYFTADWHINAPNIKSGETWPTLMRDYKSPDFMSFEITRNAIETFKQEPPTHLYFIGDVTHDVRGIWPIQYIKEEYPNCELSLIMGEIDKPLLDLHEIIFDNIYSDIFISIENLFLYLNHFPTKCQKIVDSDSSVSFGITAHVHGSWRIQRQMINVGIDVWNGRPVSIDELKWYWNIANTYFDKNHFPNDPAKKLL